MAFIGGVVMGMLCDVQQRLFSSIYNVLGTAATLNGPVGS